MKKLLFVALICILTVGLFAATPRGYTQKIQTSAGEELPGVTNEGITTAPDYRVESWVTARPGEVISTDSNAAAEIRIHRFGNGTTLPYRTVTFVQFGSWPTQWVAGETVRTKVTYLPNGNFHEWDLVIPTGTAAINYINTPYEVFDPITAPTEWDITVTSTPPGVAIWIDGMYSNFETPHTFTFEEGWDGLFTVVFPGFTWTPESYQVTDLAADLTIDFVGTPVVTPPMPPVYVAPTNGAMDLDYAGQTLEWASGDRNGGARSRSIQRDPATGYMVYFGTDNPPMTMVADQVGLTWATGPLMPLTQYYWQIVAYNTAGNTPGPVWSFMTMDVPINYYDITVTSNPAGAAIWLDGADTGFVTPHTWVDLMEGWDGLFSVYMMDYTWVPVDYQVTDLAADLTINFEGTYVDPNNYYDITVTSDPAGAAIWLDGADTGFVTPHTWYDLIEGFDGLFSVVLPYYDWMPLDYQVTDLAADMTIHFIGTCQTYTVYVTSSPIGAEIFVNGVSTGLFTTGAPGTPVVLCMPGPYTITLGPVDDGGTMYYFQPLTATTDGQELIFEGTVPVELSSFAATVTSEMFVNLQWVTESETQALGFNIYRSGNSNSAEATKVNLSVVPATNTSLQHTYTYVDDSEGLAQNNTYYYWLESVDLSGASDLHGPVNVTITGNVTPILPEISVLNNAYPNPFRMGETATIKVNIKAGETGTVTIYNLLGQAVKTYKVVEGSHTLTWNANGNASGIYFYKLSTPSTNVTKKLVIVN